MTTSVESQIISDIRAVAFRKATSSSPQRISVGTVRAVSRSRVPGHASMEPDADERVDGHVRQAFGFLGLTLDRHEGRTRKLRRRARGKGRHAFLFGDT